MKIRMITNGPGEEDWSAPYQMEPKRQISEEQSTTAYADFCEGVSKNEMVVQEVDFADGSKWEFKEPAKSK
jgi:hypothetical protein